MGTAGKHLSILIGLGILFCAVIIGFNLFFVREPAQTILLTEPTEENVSANPVQPAKNGKINLNSASAEELETLEGIGPVLAQRIVAYRNQAGVFSSVAELSQVDGIGEKTLAMLQEKVEVS